MQDTDLEKESLSSVLGTLGKDCNTKNNTSCLPSTVFSIRVVVGGKWEGLVLSIQI